MLDCSTESASSRWPDGRPFCLPSESSVWNNLDLEEGWRGLPGHVACDHRQSLTHAKGHPQPSLLFITRYTVTLFSDHGALNSFLQFVIGPVSHTLSFVFNIVSRTFEYQADAFAVHLGYAEPLKVGLIRLQVGFLSSQNTLRQ